MNQPIVLLNMLSKLIEKVIGERMQFHTIFNNFIHPYQFRGFKQQSTYDMGTFLTYIIQSRWVKNIQTSTLTFDIAQFFPSLNHLLLPLILDKMGFNPKVSKFFSDYLISRKIQYISSHFLLVLDKVQPFLLFFQPFIFYYFSIFLKNILKI